jgi:hypothetical protein
MKFGLPEEAASKYVEDQIKKYEAAKMEAAIKAKLGIKEKTIVDVWKGWFGLDKEVKESDAKVKAELAKEGVVMPEGNIMEQVKAMGQTKPQGGVVEAVKELEQQRAEAVAEEKKEKKEKKGWW